MFTQCPWISKAKGLCSTFFFSIQRQIALLGRFPAGRQLTTSNCLPEFHTKQADLRRNAARTRVLQVHGLQFFTNFVALPRAVELDWEIEFMGSLLLTHPSSIFFFGRRPLPFGGSPLEGLPVDQRGIEPPPAVCPRRQERRHPSILHG